MDRACLAGGHPGVTLEGLPEALIVEVDDLAQAATCVGYIGSHTDRSVTVPPLAATGVMLELVRGSAS